MSIAHAAAPRRVALVSFFFSACGGRSFCGPGRRAKRAPRRPRPAASLRSSRALSHPAAALEPFFMSKRALADASQDQEHTDVGPKRSRAVTCDQVQLNVGGQRFLTTVDTLTSSSVYFTSSLLHWRDHAEELFLDRDPAAFAVLLSCMRTRKALLPRSDPDLSTRVILEADFFGVDWFLRAVKARTHNHTYGTTVEDDVAVEAFDSEWTGGIEAAIDAGVLPDRFFVPKPMPQPVIRNIAPVTDTDIVFVGVAHRNVIATLRVVGMATVEQAPKDPLPGEGATITILEPIVARALSCTSTIIDTGTGVQGTALASKLMEHLRARRWMLVPRPTVQPLPKDHVLAVYGEDRAAKSVPFVEIAGSWEGGDQPAKLTMLELSSDGRLKRASDYSDFKGFQAAPFVNQSTLAQRHLAVAAVNMCDSLDASSKTVKKMVDHVTARLDRLEEDEPDEEDEEDNPNEEGAGAAEGGGGGE